MSEDRLQRRARSRLGCAYFLTGLVLLALYFVDEQRYSPVYDAYLGAYFVSAVLPLVKESLQRRAYRVGVRLFSFLYVLFEVAVFVLTIMNPQQTIFTAVLFWYLVGQYAVVLLVICCLVMVHAFTWCTTEQTQRVGATIATIERYTGTSVYETLYISSLHNQDVCAICMEEFAEKDMIRILSCRHYFHHDCIVRWLEQNKTCPYCRRPFDEQDGAEIAAQV